MIITLYNTKYTAVIDSLGAQLISFKDQAKTEYIWQRDPAHWTNCSPLLFPIVGNCRNDRTIIEGTWYELPKHGFCRTTDFQVDKQSDTCAVFTIHDTEETRRMYPYAFCLSLTYNLRDDGLHMCYQVENKDTRPIHYQIGAHPGFRCPLFQDESFEDYVLEFEKEETASTIAYDLENLQFNISDRKLHLNHNHTLPLTYDMFSGNAVFFDTIASRSVALKNPVTGKGVSVAFPDFETVAFWTSMPSKGPFLCIEPWNGSAIRSDEDDDFLNRHFLQSVLPGAEKQYHMQITILSAK